MKMTMNKTIVKSAVAALTGAAMLALAAAPASAMSLPVGALGEAAAGPQVELAHFRGGFRDGGFHGHDGWRYHDRYFYHHDWDYGYYGYPSYGYPSYPCAIFGGTVVCE